MGMSLPRLGLLCAAPSGRVTGGNVPRDTSHLVHVRHEKHGPIGALVRVSDLSLQSHLNMNGGTVELDPDKRQANLSWSTLPRRRAYNSRAHRQVTESLNRTSVRGSANNTTYYYVHEALSSSCEGKHARKITHPPALPPPQTRETWTHSAFPGEAVELHSDDGTQETRGSTCTHKQLDLL
ncbi:hypothetical protein ARMSODRAFT_62132 [Armillaria solidipes]|uniref:Uncharacterized protein n=1 Tax=Armillaria solidipes TaxID=1076256 RepID=A0A2H3BJN4_9AGAR|nr:hypothetical protein ARMSODRAFT_62132 [Armillaria solidipes]